MRLEYLHPHRVYDAVENDQADLGLVSYPKSSRTIKAIPCGKNRWFWFAPQGIDLRSANKFRWKMLPASRSLVSIPI